MKVQTRKLGDSYWCPKCRTYKPEDVFYKTKRGPHNIASMCIDCNRKSKRKYANRNARFWATFKKKTREEGGCSLWLGNYMKGRPAIRWNCTQKSVRRVAYSLSRADVPDDVFIEMTCKNDRCVKVSHMKLISSQSLAAKLANNAARGDKNGSRLRPESRPRGEQNNKAKLTEADVVAIRKRHASKEASTRVLACEYGVAWNSINSIIRRKTWAHVPDPEEIPDA